MKPTAFIHGWQLWESRNILIGRISDHPHQDTFHGPLQQTSNIVDAPQGFVKGARVETLNTVYILGGTWGEQEEKKLQAIKDLEKNTPVSA